MDFFKGLYKRKSLVLKKRLAYFLDNTDISGIRFLSDKYGTPAKIFWGIAIITSFLGMLEIFQLTLQRFHNDDISISVDTAFLHWESTFPAVSICLQKGKQARTLTSYIRQQKIPHSGDVVSFSKFVHRMLFLTPSSMKLVGNECEGLNETCGLDFKFVREKFLTRSCKDIVTEIRFNGKLYENCEDIFKLHRTEVGICFIANSIVDYDLDVSKVPIKFTRETKDRTLRFRLKENSFWKYMIHVHSPEDFPINAGKFSVLLSSQAMEFLYLIEEIINEDGVRATNIKHRNCRFPDEILPGSGYHYSFSTCMSDLRIRLELKLCNCTLFISPYKYIDKYCNIEGMNCIVKAKIRSRIKDLQSSPATACLPSCIEQGIWEIGQNTLKNDHTGVVVVGILNLPTLRYQRQVVKTTLDLVVAIGGVAGLFFGASILNIVEFIYIWFIRKF